MPDGFAHEGLGQVLFHLSEFRLNSHRWIDEQEIILPEHVSSDFSVSDGLSVYPKEGIPYLQLDVRVEIKDVSQRYWWNILVNLRLDDDQSILCRLWSEALPSNPYGPQVISEIYRASLPGGQNGVNLVEDACQSTFDHLKQTLAALLTRLPGPSDS